MRHAHALALAVVVVVVAASDAAPARAAAAPAPALVPALDAVADLEVRRVVLVVRCPARRGTCRGGFSCV